MLLAKRVMLRAIERQDLDALNSWWNDPALSALLGTRRHLSAPDETEAWYDAILARVEPHEGRTYAVCATVDGRLLGTAWYGSFDAQDRNVEVGLYLGQEEDRGRGLGTETMGLLLSYLFEDLGVHKVRLLVRSDHDRAVRCYERLGFQHEGMLRHHRFFAGTHHDFMAMGMLASEHVTRGLDGTQEDTGRNR